MASFDEEVDGFVLIPHGNCLDGKSLSNKLSELPYLDDISQAVNDLSEDFWPINKKIHDNPERGFKEFIAHDALTQFMRGQSGWVVTPSAYGMATAWVAVFDTGRRGPVVSFNAEMGEHLSHTHHLLGAEQNLTTVYNRLSSRHWPCVRP